MTAAFTYAAAGHIAARRMDVAPELLRWTGVQMDGFTHYAISYQDAQDLCHGLSADAVGLAAANPHVSHTAARSAAQLLMAMARYERDRAESVTTNIKGTP